MNQLKKLLLVSLIFISASIAFIVGCGNSEPVNEQTNTISFGGTVKAIKLEGGFYGIISDDGKNYNPLNLPQDFQQDELRVSVTAIPQKEVMTIQMWGIPIRIIDIKKK